MLKLAIAALLIMIIAAGTIAVRRIMVLNEKERAAIIYIPRS